MPIALTCRTCGRDYEMPDDRAMWPCAGCSTMNAPPKAEGEALDKLQRALRLRTRGEFQLAEQSYNAVLVEYDDEHEALWGRVLCHYGVEFVVDEKTQRRYPLVHIPRKTLMQESADFQQACNLAPEEIRRQYEEDAAYVDDAQAEIRALAEKCPAYDVFICHKTTQLDSNAKTEDYSWAYGLYHSLDKQGYRVFFAPEELAGVAGANYEAGIYHALYTSRVMLVICSDPAYLNSTWVQSEWQRYLEMMSSEQDDTPRKLVPLLYGDMSAGRLPTAFRRRKLQAITMSNFGADAALLNVLEETCGPRGLPEPEAAEDDEFTVAEVPGGCRITGYKGDAGDLVVPEKIRGMDVVAIASGVFEDHDDLTSVILPMSVETIGEKAFKGCSRLGSVILPVELREIGNMAFNGCRSLTAVQLPETVTHIGHYAFFGCSALADMQLPEGITEIGTGVFHGCSQLERVDIPESVTEIQRTAFGSCHALQSLTLSRNIQKIARDAFGDCRSLTLRVCEDTPAHRYAMDRRLRFEMIREDAPETPAPKRPKENPDAYRIVAEKCRGCTLCVPACPEGCISGDVRKPHSIDASLCTGCGACGEACMFGAVAAPVRKAEAAKPAPVQKAAPAKPKPTAPKSMPKTAPGTKITTIDLGSVPKAAPVQAKPAPVKPGPAAVAPAMSAQVTKPAVPEPAKARSVTPAGDFVTEAVEGGLSIEKYTGTQAVVEIPAVINGKPVVEIGISAFENCKHLTEVVVPEGVMELGIYAFSDCGKLRSVHLPETLKRIGWSAFSGCKMLTEVRLPACITTGELTDNWFADCTRLTKITAAPGGVLRVRDGVLFDNAGRLICYPAGLTASRYTVPGGVKTIASGAFMGCAQLEEITLPESLAELHGLAFGGCQKLTHVKLPDSVSMIMLSAFNNCAVHTLTVPRGAELKCSVSDFAGILRVYRDSPAHRTAVEKKLRYDLIDEETAKPSAPAKAPAAPASHFETAEVSGGLAIKKYTGSGGEVVIPAVISGKSVVEIGEEAFVQNKTLRSVVIPEGVKKIGAWAFDECSALESVSIPASVTEMGDNPFCRTKALQRITVAEGNPAFHIRSNVLYSRSGKLISYPCGLPGTECAIPNGVSVIGRSAFNGCKALRRVFFPDTLTEIGSLAFHAAGLIFVNLPARVQKLGNNPFSNCPGLRGVSVAEGNEAFYERDGVLFSREGALVCYAAGRSDSEYTIPSGVRAIANNAFQGNGSIMRVRIPDSVTDVGDSAFCECKSLTQIDVPESVKNLGYGCFEDCSNLTKVTLHEGLQEIHTDAFRNCEMPILDIPYSVKKVYTETFRGFKGLLRVYENSISHKVAVQKGLWHDVLRDVPAEAMAKAVASMSEDEFVAAIDKLIAGESGASGQETKLMSRIADAVNAQDFKTSPVPLGVEIVSCVSEERELVIPGKVGDKAVRGIGVNAFAGNRNITSIELPEGIAYIREGAFSGCTALKEINIPASVKVIGDSAFKGCTALKLPLKVKLRFMGSKLFG